MQRVELPNGLWIWAPNKREALILHREVAAMGAYDQHGIHVGDGDLVMDVGANVGMYALHLARTRKRLRVHAFEPVPETFAILECNVDEHMQGHDVVLHPLGVSSQGGTATFEVPENSFSASMRPKDVNGAVRGRSVVAWTRAIVDDSVRAGLLSARAGDVARSLLRHERIAEAVLAPLSALERRHARLRTRSVECALTTISDVIDAHALPSVDVVKIDVEGAEEAVLDGIRAEHWTRVRQLAIEVHDVDGRLERMASRLRGLGFTVVTAREDWAVLDLMGIQILYATRDGRE
jgi:FkbM family methyltransferase